MKNFLKSWQAKVLAILLIIAIAVCASSYALGGRTSWVARAAGFLVTPIQTASSRLTGSVSRFLGNVTHANELAEENEALHEELDELRSQLSDYNEISRENDLYRYYLGLAEEHPDFEFCAAEVVSRSPSDLYQGFVINAGTLQGVALYDPVITDAGLVGYVCEVSETFSRVQTVLHPDFRAGCRISRTNDSGILSGSALLAEEGTTGVDYISRNSLVTVGDLVETTGLTGIFPAGLIIGTVTEVTQGNQGVSLTAVVTPAVRLADITDVFIITDFEGQGASLEDFIAGEADADE